MGMKNGTLRLAQYTRLKPLFWKSLFRALGVYRVPRRAATDDETGVLLNILCRDDCAAWERAEERSAVPARGVRAWVIFTPRTRPRRFI